MPRLAPALLREARASHVLLPLLLRECRDLPSARNELRWLQEHAHESHSLPGRLATPNKTPRKTRPSAQEEKWKNLTRNARRRAKGEPLQYIVGTQPFGDLQILCREGVLIPRPETEAYTARLGSILNRARKSSGNTISQGDTLRILDLCTGTGCISLLLHSMLKPVGGNISRKVKIMGVDISDEALALARDNLEYNIGENLLDLSAVSDITFRKASVFDICNGLVRDGVDLGSASMTFDVIISNPPYVAEKDYQPGGITTRSVRNFEPKRALVPETSRMGDLSHEEGRSPTHDGDAFYQPLLDIAEKVEASIVVLETGDHHQALRVHRMAQAMHRQNVSPAMIEVWDDDASDIELANAARHRARSVVIWTGNAMQLRKSMENHMH
jgi:HemK-like putative methylase